jgi:hypothetical protein
MLNYTQTEGKEKTTSGMMGRQKRDGNHSPFKNKLVQD